MISYGIDLLKKQERGGTYHLVAIALDKAGRILSTSFNSYCKTHPTQAKFANKAGLPEKVFLHAEIGALVKAKMQVDELIVVRIGKNGKPLPAKPCPICQLAIEEHGVRKVTHT